MDSVESRIQKIFAFFLPFESSTDVHVGYMKGSPQHSRQSPPPSYLPIANGMFLYACASRNDCLSETVFFSFLPKCHFLFLEAHTIPIFPRQEIRRAGMETLNGEADGRGGRLGEGWGAKLKKDKMFLFFATFFAKKAKCFFLQHFYSVFCYLFFAHQVIHQCLATHDEKYLILAPSKVIFFSFLGAWFSVWVGGKSSDVDLPSRKLSPCRKVHADPNTQRYRIKH